MVLQCPEWPSYSRAKRLLDCSQVSRVAHPVYALVYFAVMIYGMQEYCSILIYLLRNFKNQAKVE